MSNILFLISSDNMIKGGSEEVLRLIVSHYLNQNAEVYVYFLLEKRYGHWEQLNYPNLHLFYSKGGGKTGIFSIVRNFYRNRKIEFDYAFSSIVECTGLLGILRRLRLIKTKYLIGRESTLVFKRFSGSQLFINKLMYRMGYKAVDVIICQTQLMKDELLKNVPYINRYSKVVVIPNPVDFEKIHRLEKETIELNQYKPFFVAAGRLIKEKGYDVLLEAFKKIKINYPSITLLILGEGILTHQIELQIDQLDLKKDVFLMGLVPNVYPYFSQAQMCVVSSRIEGFPNVLLQMMSQNEKVVSTLCAGDIDKIEGLYTCAPNDVDALYEAMERCLNDNTSDNRIMFDKELISRSIEKFIQKVQTVCVN